MDRNLISGINRAINIVALRKESVDRNVKITIVSSGLKPVALRKESVDRNIGPLIFNVQPRSRSPQGERG